MDTDLAILGIEIQTEGLEKSLDGLDRLYAKSRETEKNLQLVNLTVPAEGGVAASGRSPEQSPEQSLQSLQSLDQSGSRVGTRLNSIFGRAFDRFIIDGRTAGSVVQSLERDLLRLGRQQLFGNGSVTGGLFSSLSSLAGDYLSNAFAGYAGGGQFTVGGVAGRDRNLVGLRLTRGERVTVQTPAQQKQGSVVQSAPAVNMSFNISTPDAQSFRLSQSQIQSEALRSARRLLNRNGMSS